MSAATDLPQSIPNFTPAANHHSHFRQRKIFLAAFLGTVFAMIISLCFNFYLLGRSSTATTKCLPQDKTLTPDSLASPTPTPTPKVSLSQLPEGQILLEGYFTPTPRNAWGETAVCDSFTVTTGSPEFINRFISAVKDGNTVNSLNHQDQLVINLDLTTLTLGKQEQIYQSTPTLPVSLIATEPQLLETEVPVCFSFINLIDVI